MSHYKFQCPCGCTNLEMMHEGAEVRSRIQDIFIENTNVSTPIVERGFMTKDPTEFRCEACKQYVCLEQSAIAFLIQKADPRFVLVVLDRGDTYRDAAVALRNIVKEFYEDALDRGSEVEYRQLEEALSKAKKAGI
jgi:hypothetical protein